MLDHLRRLFWQNYVETHDDDVCIDSVTFTHRAQHATHAEIVNRRFKCITYCVFVRQSQCIKRLMKTKHYKCDLFCYDLVVIGQEIG